MIKLNKISYRPELDGLRGLLVLLILMSHAACKFVPGAFIAVDFFFVLSGFLMTQIILKANQEHSFSFSDYLTRRVRRLFPALYVSLFLGILPGFCLLAPGSLVSSAKSMLLNVVPLSNLYFSTYSHRYELIEQNIFLPTWTLSLEMQFYIVLPFLVFLCLRFKSKSLYQPLVALGLLSLVLSQWMIDQNRAVAFFLLPFRLFEFILGSLILSLPKPKIFSKIYYEGLTVMGLSGLGLTVFTYFEGMPYPGVRALIPSLSAVALIYGIEHSSLKKIFTFKPLYHLGIISYSVYIIHGPLMIYYHTWRVEDISAPEKFFLVILSIGLGQLLWRFVETPFRIDGDEQKNNMKFFKGLSIVALILVLMSGSIIYFEGWPGRFSRNLVVSIKENLLNRRRYWDVFFKHREKYLSGALGAKYIAIIGNLHAIDLIHMLRESGSELNLTLIETTKECSFIYHLKSNATDDCKKRIDLLDYGKDRESLGGIYLSEFWKPELKDHLDETLLKLQQFHVPITIFGPRAFFQRGGVPFIINNHLHQSDLNQLGYRYLNKDYIELNSRLAQKYNHPDYRSKNIFYVDMLSLQCGQKMKACDIISTETMAPLYFDFTHLTLEGARHFGTKLKTNYPELL